MSQSNEFDVGPLTWVKSEIDAALNAARERLTEVQVDPSQREPLRFAQSHVHQASGALSIVGLDGVSQFAEAIDKLLSALASSELTVSEEILTLALSSIGMLGNYINELAAGAPHQPLRLFPAYQELVSARGVEQPQPSELFFPDLSVRPQLASTESIAPERAAHELRVLRGRFEKGLLNWLRKPQDQAGPMEMLTAVHRIEQIQSLPATRAFWWASIAFFEGLALQAIPADRQAQRLCRRIDTQMKRLLEGSQIVADRLVRDVLYFVATAGFDSEHARDVRSTYGLDKIMPSADAELSDTLRQPYVMRVRETLEHAKESWNRFCAGAAVALPQFHEQLEELIKRTEPMRLNQVDTLLSGLKEAIIWLRADPLRLSDDFSMEVATSLLLIEQACESPNADPALLRRQVEMLSAQFSARISGGVVMELDLTPFGEASRRAQERLFFNQLAREILTNLGQIEQTLDGFFRDTSTRDTLPSLTGPLKQIEGAFSVLGEMQAAELVRNNAAAIAAFSEKEEAPTQEEFDDIAHQLSALGFYVEALKNGPARLAAFLDPKADRIDQERVSAVNGTVEAQLKRETRETESLLKALKESPEDAFLREQLVSSLEAIREDAQLVADNSLEEKVRTALASLKSGEATQEEISQALAGMSTQEAAAAEPDRMLSASEQEVDAELLEIFLEEAVEVLATIAEHRNIVAANVHDFDALTTVRRGFHTLKGSSRMVGLNEFSDAAKHIEMMMNRWLQLEKDADTRLISVLDNACLCFGAWVEQLQTGGSLSRDASALVEETQKLLSTLDLPADEQDATPAAAASITRPEAEAEPIESLPEINLDLDAAEPETEAEQPIIFDQAETPVPAASSELDLTSTLMDFDLANISSGEQHDTEVDLAVTDFEGDAMRVFSEEFGSAAAETAAQQQAERFQAAQDLAAPEELDLELDDFDLGEEELPQQEEAAPASGTNDPATVELDLTRSMTTPDLDSLMGAGEDHTELDLSATDFAGDSLLATLDVGEAQPAAETSAPPAALELDIELDIPELEEALPELSEAAPAPVAMPEIASADAAVAPELQLPELNAESILETPAESATGAEEQLPELLEELSSPPNEGEQDLLELTDILPEDTLPSVSAEPSEAETEEMINLPAQIAESAIEPAEAAVEETLEEIAIDDGEDDGEALPALNLSALNVPDPVNVTDAPVVDESASDSDITIGNQTLSRGLYELYIAEARQLLDNLLDEHTRLSNNPLRVPTIDAIRAAHTLAGISGTARVESAYALGKALEHAMHRFTDVETAPVAAQTDVFGTAILTLDGMLAEVVHQVMPAEAPELIERLKALHPLSAEEEAAEAPAAITEEASPVEEVPVEEQIAASLPSAPLPDDTDVALKDDLDEQLLEIFFEEADELSDAMAGVLRDMRTDPADASHHQALARHLHTIKGSARMAGAMRLGQYIHNLESHLEHALLNKQAGPVLVDDLENGLDQIGAMIELLKNPPPPAAEAAEEDEENSEQLHEADEQPETATASPAAAPETPAKTSPAAPARPAMPQPTPVFEDLDAVQGQARAPLRVKAEMIDRFVNEAGEVSIARTRIEGELRTLRRSLLDLTENVIRLRNQLREVEIQAESQMQSRIAQAESQHANFDPLEFDRFTRLQELTRMMAESVGDVTTIQQNLLRNIDGADAALHAQGRLSRDLQQALMSVRMVPFEELSDRLYRVVRQTAKELGKRANLDIQGGAIEIDRGVLDRMTAPIEHLLRNSIAHGIESPEERAAAGKPEFGQITLKLTQLSNEIALELADDGKGLDYGRILARGRAAGLLSEDEHPSENRLTQLIFEPGFSTAESVSGVAGRGVGMDVVKNEALSVGGRIEVFSETSKGSRFLIHLPLTLAVTQALLVRSGERTFAIPSNMVEQALELKEGPLDEVRSKGFVEWKEIKYPFTYLPRLLGDLHAHPQPGRYHWVLLVRAGNEHLAVHIDELRGNQEIVVKNAGPQFVRLQGYSGATVLADGEISLIINPIALAARQTAPAEVLGEAAEMFEPGYVEPAEARIPSIMVVDDSLTVRKITSRMLEREGFQVVTAKDGVDALEQLVEYKPDVMLLDIEMPRMDGFDLARNVRADERLKDVPIIMITSRMADKHRNYAMEIGVNHYLGKPYQEEQLLELITGFIAAQRQS